MAVNNGTDILLSLEASNVNGSTSQSMSNTADMIEVTTKDSNNFKEFLAGELGATINVEGMWDEGATYGYSDLFAAYKARTAIAFIFGGTTSGDEIYTGSCLISQLDVNGPKNEASTWSATLQVTGEVSASTVTP